MRAVIWQALVMVIPVHDENPLRRTPWVTYALIAINVVVLLLTPGMLPGSLGPAATVCQQQAFDYQYGAVPRELVKDRPLREVVTGQVTLTPRGPACVVGHPGYHKNPVLSVLTAMFVHAGWLHLLGNMLFLLVFGNNVEDRFRKIPYLIFYVACSFLAAYWFACRVPGSVEQGGGAAVALAGLRGAHGTRYPRARWL